VSASLTILALLGLRRAWRRITAPQRAAFLVPFLTFPITYYVVVFMPRYGAPLTGLLLTLAGVEVWGWIDRVGGDRACQTPGIREGSDGRLEV
jgi:hypothetical protein